MSIYLILAGSSIGSVALADPLRSCEGVEMLHPRPVGSAPFERFTNLYATGELIEFHQVVDTIIAWGDEILARYDTGRPSNGRLEGTNNLLQVLRRVSPTASPNPDNFAARGLLLT